MLGLSDMGIVFAQHMQLVYHPDASLIFLMSSCMIIIIIFNDCLFCGQSHLLYWLGTDVSGIMYLLYSQESMMKKKIVKLKKKDLPVCSKCGRPKTLDETIVTPTHAALINDNIQGLEALPLC